MPNPVNRTVDRRSLVIRGLGYDQRTIASGQTVSRGDVLGIVSANGHLAVCDSAAVDGSQVARAVAVRDVDAAGAAVTGISVLTVGEVNGELLTFGGSDTLADHYDELRDVGIVANSYDGIGRVDNA